MNYFIIDTTLSCSSAFLLYCPKANLIIERLFASFNLAVETFLLLSGAGVLPLLPVHFTRSSSCCWEVTVAYRPGVSFPIRATACRAGFNSSALEVKCHPLSPCSYFHKLLGPPAAPQADRWSALSESPIVLCLLCTVPVSWLSPGDEGQRWAWCAELHPAAAELGVDGSRSSKVSLWCFAVGSRAPSLSQSSSAGCTACAGHRPQCRRQQTDLQKNYRQRLDRCEMFAKLLLQVKFEHTAEERDTTVKCISPIIIRTAMFHCIRDEAHRTY